MIQFKADVWETGGNKVVTIPSRYIKDGNIDISKTLKITAQEVKE